MKSTRAIVMAAGLSIGLGLTGAARAQSGAELTPAAQARGFQLSTFISDIPLINRPVGIAFREDGQVLVSDYGGAIRLYPSHADAWTFADGVQIAYHGYEGAYDFAQYQAGRGYRTFMSQPQLDRVVEITPDGVIEGAMFTDLTWPASLAEAPAGLRGPSEGHLLIACADGIYDLDPRERSIVRRLTEDVVHGLQFSRDGATVLAALDDRIRGYDLATGQVIFDTFDSGPIEGDVRDVVQGVGGLAGNLYVGTLSGDLWEISQADPAQRTLLVTGGSASFFMTPDSAAPGPDSGLVYPSLLICRGDEVLRLSLREAGFFSPFGPYCAADMDRDGLVDFSDYLIFLNAYEGQEPTADLDGDGLVDFTDYLSFLDSYSLGC